MWLKVHSEGLPVDDAMRERLHRRMQFALSRFGSDVNRVAVYFRDDNGPDGGLDKRCRIVVSLRATPKVIVEDCDRDLEPLIYRAVNRVSQTVSRRLSRRFTLRRPIPWTA